MARTLYNAPHQTARQDCVRRGATVKVAVIDDYQNTFTEMAAYPLLKGHEVTVFPEP